ncbi:MAG TPA: MFS transporter, partial [Aggregatilineales bacterium]|nr:MFS transporter [Aggregatilineales bacterium]
MTDTTKAPSQLDFNRVAPLFALTFVDVLGLTIILPLLHLYAAAYGATPVQIGLTLAAFPLAQLIGVPVMGALSDRFGRKPLLLIS